MKRPVRRQVLDVCAECATAAGGVWPKGHVATISTDACDVCGTRQAVSPPGDWNWPKGLPRGWAAGGRD